jgi:transposase
MAMFVGLDVSLKTTLICIVEADGASVWEGKVESEPTSLVKALARRREQITLVGIEACPLSEWLYGALVESGFQAVCIETRHAQRYSCHRDRTRLTVATRGIADMMRLGHYRPVHVKSKASQLLRTVLIARKKFVDHTLAIENTIDRSGHVSKCGDKLMRHALYEAANAHLRRSTKWSVLRAWGVKLTKRIGAKKACVAVARKLERPADTRGPAGTATDAQGRPAASDPAAGEKGIDDALFLGFYLVWAVELILSARGFSRCTRNKDAPRFARAFNA